jgi:hypothetical protein
VLRSGRRLFVNDYELTNAEFGARVPLLGKPLALTLNYIDNRAVASQNQAGRVDLTYGDRKMPGGFWDRMEYGLVYERVDRDAVPGAFADDDWWFKSDFRGPLAFVGQGIDQNWSWRLWGTNETRDGVARKVKRVMIDVSYEF